MTRAGLSFLAVVLAFGSCRTCVDPGIPRNYQCSADAGPGVDECPDEYDEQGQLQVAWACNGTWGFCFDTARGEANPCRVDAECGGGWRCTPDGRCGDPATEGAVSVVDLDDTETVQLSPNVFAQRPVALRASEAVRLSGAKETFSAVAGRRGPGADIEWLTVQSREDPEGEEYQSRRVVVPAPQVQTFAVSIASGGSGPRHFLWTVEGGRVQRAELLSGGTVSATTTVLTGVAAGTGLSPLRTGGSDGLSLGAVGIRLNNSFLASTPLGPDGGADLSVRIPVGDVQDAVWVTGPGCPVLGALVLATPQGFSAFSPLDGGAPFWSAPAGSVRDLRLFLQGPRTWLSWRRPGQQGGQLELAEVTGVCQGLGSLNPILLGRRACPDGEFVGYDLVDLGLERPAFVTECLSDDRTTHLVFVGDRTTPSAYLPRRLSSEEGSMVFSRFDDGQLAFGPSLFQQQPLSLPRPPEVLVPGDGGLLAFTPNASFLLQDWGFLLSRREAWESLPVAWLPEEGWTVTRTGVVVDEDGRAAALPEEDWSNPSGVVLATVLPTPSGGGVLVASHDDAVDVAELDDDQPTLVTRLRPSPATPILSMALQPARDGGTAEGFLVAGLELFEVRASTPRRWTSTPVGLAGLRPVFVWFDGERPRALLDDGTVLGLVTRVPLSDTLEDEVRAGGALCGAPFALTDDALWRLTPAGADAGRPYTWDFVDLPGAEVQRPDGGVDVTDFSRGRLLVHEDALYVFSNSGAAWKVTPEGGACPGR